MATNYISSGDVVNVVIASDVASGEMRLHSNIIGIALNAGVTGDIVPFEVSSVWEVPCSGDAFAVGQPLHYDVAGDTLYASDTPEVGDVANVAMSFSPGGGAATLCNAKLNTHLGDFVVAP